MGREHGQARFPIIAGPTAGGKSSLAVGAALALRGLGREAEIISADSMQVYRGLDIGTAKPSGAERRGVAHHLIDVAEPTEAFTVHDWLGAAEGLIGSIRGRGAFPIVAGGTHLYVKALLEGMFEGPAPDAALREELRRLGQRERRAELERVDAAAAARIHPNDERRTIRALEVHRQTGRPISEHQRQWDRGAGREDRVLIGLEWPTEMLNRRINARVREIVERGLVEEVRGLWAAGRLGPQAREGLGYKQLVEHFEGHCGLEDAVERIKIETRRFAKSQRTWLRRLRSTPGSVWIDCAATEEGERVEAVVRACIA